MLKRPKCIVNKKEARFLFHGVVLASCIFSISSKASVPINDGNTDKFIWSAITGLTIADKLKDKTEIAGYNSAQHLSTATGTCVLLSSGKEIIDTAMSNDFSATDIIIYAAGCSTGGVTSRLIGRDIMIMPNLPPTAVNNDRRYGIIFQILF